jgi:hypothetical protein
MGTGGALEGRGGAGGGISAGAHVMKAFFELTPLEELVTRLQAFTRRPLKTRPPTDTDTMATIGVSKTNLDAFIRPFVNERFGTRGKPLYARGKLTSDVTFKALREKCGL